MANPFDNDKFVCCNQTTRRQNGSDNPEGSQRSKMRVAYRNLCVSHAELIARYGSARDAGYKRGQIDAALQNESEVAYQRKQYDDLYGIYKELLESNASPPPEGPTWLEHAQKITTQDRETEYGHPAINFLRIALRWNMYLNERLMDPISPVDVVWMMIDTKLARETEVHKDDNGIDIIGYASCYDRIDRYMKELGYDKGAEAFRDMNLEDLVGLLDEMG